MPDDPKQLIEGEVLTTLDMQKSLEDLQNELMQNEQFRRFLELSKTVPQQIEETWKRVESEMVEHNIKKISGDWGSLTIAERIGWNIDLDQLSPRFIKKVPDTKKITDTYRLEGKEPRGCVKKTSKYLTKRLK